MPNLKTLLSQVEAKQAAKPPKVFSRGTRPDTLTKLPIDGVQSPPTLFDGQPNILNWSALSPVVDKRQEDTVKDTDQGTDKNTDTDTVLDTDKSTQAHTGKSTVTDTDRVLDTQKSTDRNTDTDTVRDTDIVTVRNIDTAQKNKVILNELPEQQKKVLLYLLSIRDFNNSAITRPVGYDKVAKILNSKRAFAQKCINKLIERGFLIRKDSFNKMIKGTIYAFNNIDTDTVIDTDTDTVRNTNTVRPMDTDLDTEMDTRSSSRLINKTTTEKENFRNQLEQCCDNFKLTPLNISPSDLSQLWLVWSRNEFGTLEQFLLSAEHLGFYLNDETLSKGIQNPRAYFMSKLREGFYDRPAGFVSLQVKRERAKREDLARILQEIREEKQKTFDLEFEIWLERLSPDDKKKHLRGTPMISDFDSIPAQAVLRDIFKKERG